MDPTTLVSLSHAPQAGRCRSYARRTHSRTVTLATVLLCAVLGATFLAPRAALADDEGPSDGAGAQGSLVFRYDGLIEATKQWIHNQGVRIGSPNPESWLRQPWNHETASRDRIGLAGGAESSTPSANPINLPIRASALRIRPLPSRGQGLRETPIIPLPPPRAGFRGIMPLPPPRGGGLRGGAGIIATNPISLPRPVAQGVSGNGGGHVATNPISLPRPVAQGPMEQAVESVATNPISLPRPVAQGVSGSGGGHVATNPISLPRPVAQGPMEQAVESVATNPISLPRPVAQGVSGNGGDHVATNPISLPRPVDPRRLERVRPIRGVVAPVQPNTVLRPAFR